MFGLDDSITSASDGTSLCLVALVAILLGLRHATDPDHVTAVTTLVASTRDRATRRAAALGVAWGLGHALALFAFGLPLLLFGAALPDTVRRLAETAVALLIVGLAVRLLVRWRGGRLVVHPHPHAHGARTASGAFGIGLVHGMSGSAGVGVLIVASVATTSLAVVALALLAACTAVSMTLLTTGFGRALVSRPVRAAFGAVAPALGAGGLAFGLWYGGAAWSVFPYPF